MVTEEIEGELADEADPVDIDRDSLVDAYAVSLLAGNADIHGSNLMVQEDGEVGLFDYDFGGNPMFGETHFEGGKTSEEMQSVFQQNVEWSLSDAGLHEDEDHTEVANEALERAQEIAMGLDVDEVTEHISNDSFKQILRENVGITTGGRMGGITVHRLNGEEYEPIMAIQDGEVTEGGDEHVSVARQIEGLDDEEILERFDGPYLVASLDED